MYESFYGLREKPFSLLPDPDYLYLSPKHLRALTLLEYGMMNQAGFSVICGDTGAGKTTLIRRLLAELGDDTTVGLITNTHKSFGELLSWVLMAFGIDGENRTKAQLHQLLIEFLVEQYAQNRRTVLIVDEAQNMTADQLEELRMLSNINADKDQVLQVILAGQPALRETLRKPELMQFAQRIAVDYYLESLSRDETEEYIRHRLEVAGGSPDIFTPAACHAVYRYSGGTPRLINLLCDTTLVYGFAEQTPHIEAQLVEDVVREQHRNSIVPTFNKPAPDVPPAPAVETPRQKQTETLAEPAVAVEQPAKVETSEQRQAASDYEAVITARHTEAHAAQVNAEAVTPAPKPHAEAASENFAAEKKSAAHKPKVTPINKQSTARPVVNEKPVAHESPATESATPKQESPAHTESPTPQHAADNNQYKDIYPIVHIAEEPRKNLNVLILGFIGGMVLASALTFGAVYMMFSKQNTDTPATAAPATQAAPAPAPVVNNDAALEAERIRLEALQKERDAALAMQEALQRERDAALANAKAQEQLRAAEKRAAEMVAEQNRRSAEEMERAQQRILDAEVAAAKARERERIAREQAEQARLQNELNERNPPAPVAPAPAAPVEAAPAPQTNAKPAVNTAAKPRDDAQFSTNPCNSPSAKFLSTCKK
jgi:type II secretory pathway predicted ATPase ExeA